MEQLVFVGILIILIGFALVIMGTISKSKRNVEWVFGGFIGPIPFGAASKNYLLVFLIIIFMFLLIISFILSRVYI
jgi:uncharacterized membrane protein